MKANIVVHERFIGKTAIERVEVLKTFKFRDCNFFVHYDIDDYFFVVSHWETGYRVCDRKINGFLNLKRVRTIKGVIKKSVAGMSEISESKFKEVIDKKMKSYKTNKTEDFKIV